MHVQAQAGVLRRRLTTVLSVIIVSLALALTLAPQASASPTNRPPQLTAEQQYESQEVQKIFDSGAFANGHLDYAQALAATTSDKVVRDFAVGTLAAQGTVSKLSTSDRGQVQRRAIALGGSGKMTAKATACLGNRGLYYRWYGVRADLKDCDVAWIKDNLETVGIAAAVLANIFDLDKRSAAIIAVAGVIVAAGSWALNKCNSKHRGVRVYVIRVGTIYSPWCRSQ